MANVELKKDFRDGQLLYGDDLNNNFQVIEAGINANEENLQGVIDQAQEDLRNELEEITGERGWDWNDNSGERVTFYKGDTNQVNEKPISNGQLLYDIITGETALDTSGKRVKTGAGNILAVSDEEPTNPGTKVWIKPNELQKVDSTEVIDSLEGNETNLAPSVRAVKEMKGNIDIEEITLLTANEGFTITFQKFFKQGKHIWGDAVITTDVPFSGSYSYPVKLAYPIPYIYNSYCILAEGTFDAVSIGYLYVGANDVDSLLIADNLNSGKRGAKIHLDYVINE